MMVVIYDVSVKMRLQDFIDAMIGMCTSSLSRDARKPVFWVSHLQVRHKPGCTTTEDG